MSELILVQPLEPGIVSVTMNRARKRNALSIALLEELIEAIETLEEDRNNRVVILRGAGPVFSAGLDLQEAADSTCIERSARAVQSALGLVQRTSLVVVAVVQGGAYAGGAGLMAACDLVIAAEDAQIGFPEARRGLLPALILDVLGNKLREGDLHDLLLSGDPIDARRALQMGLVQRIAVPGQELDRALAAARSIRTGGPETIRLTKALLREAGRGQQSTDHLIASHLTARHSDEAREGLRAFTERREPDWS